MPYTSNNFSFLNNDDIVAVARRLLGCEILYTQGNKQVRLRIVEVEAYHQSDAASHSYNGKTPRTEVMFGPAGHVYVYFTYGMHYCMNIVSGPEGTGSGSLIRALEPLEGEDILKRNRPGFSGAQLTNGPAKICQALRVTKAMNGHDLHEQPLQLIVRPALPKRKIVQTTRIGISQARDVPWRFYIKDNPYVSKTV